jgi:hypothetical protein
MTTIPSLPLALLACLLLLGCDATSVPEDGDSPQATGTPAASPEAGGSPVVGGTDDPSLLPPPFTADQIRDEWVAGLTLVMRTDSREGGALERWTVVAADAEGADIQFQQIDAAGSALGEPRVGRSSWVELRDHANFPADRATREEATRDTALGELDGWLYLVPDEAAGTVQEFFFARSLPGAPVQMRVLQDGKPIMTLAQIERERPAAP